MLTKLNITDKNVDRAVIRERFADSGPVSRHRKKSTTSLVRMAGIRAFGRNLSKSLAGVM